MDKEFLEVLTFGHWEKTIPYFKPERYHGFTYRITHSETSEFYLGKRLFSKGWKTYTGSSKSLNERLKTEYDMFTFEIVELFTSEEDMVMRERQMINSAKILNESLLLNLN